MLICICVGRIIARIVLSRQKEGARRGAKGRKEKKIRVRMWRERMRMRASEEKGENSETPRSFDLVE